MYCLRYILGITWQDKVTNKVVLEKAGIPSLYTLLKQRRMRWLEHVTRMKDGCIPKDLLYGKLVTGKRPTGRPQLRFKDVCKRDLQALGINTDSWEVTASIPTTAFTCSKCGRDCHCYSRIGLHSHNRRCTMGANPWSLETDRCQ